MTVSGLLDQSCNILVISWLYQTCYNNLVTFLLYHDCIRLVRTTLWHSCHIMTVSDLLEQPCNILVISWLYHADLLEQPCDKSGNTIKLVTTTGNKQCEHNLSTACEQIVTTCLQTCAEQWKSHSLSARCVRIACSQLSRVGCSEVVVVRYCSELQFSSSQ
jgi:hypothetical protein